MRTVCITPEACCLGFTISEARIEHFLGLKPI